MNKMQKAIFAAGCFWQAEAEFRKIKGVISTSVGYAGGSLDNPSYRQVCTDKTGHAEVVEVTYDPKIIPYKKLLDVFWQIHDPTQLNRQGPDIGNQYRSAIFYCDEKQRNDAIKSKKEYQKKLKNKIVTEIIPIDRFYKAEDYHQQYLEKQRRNPVKNMFSNIFRI